MAHSSRLTFSSAAAMAVAAAGDGSAEDDDEEPGEEIESAPPLRVGEERAIAASGLRKRLLRAGQGWASPVFGDEVTVHYSGTLRDGSRLASTREGGEPRTIKLGNGEVVAGLEQGISTMRKGERALFTLPSSLGYGDTGAPGVPPGSELCFEVELLSWFPVVDIYKDGGIVKKILSTGDNRQTGDLDEVRVKYTAKLLDGSVVEETSEDGQEFYVNEGQFCPALPQVLKTMKEGEKASVMVQPQYAFGEQGRAAKKGFPAIPPNAPMNMDVELLSIKPVLDVTGDLKVLKKTLRTGEGIRTPHDGETVHVRYVGMLDDGSIFEKFGFEGGPFEFVIDEEQVTAGLDGAVATMVKGELAKVTVKPEYGLGNAEVRKESITIPPYSTLIYEVELVDFIKEKEPWEMSSHEKVEAADKAKNLGNELFKIAKFQRAARKYDKAVSYVNEDDHYEDGAEGLIKALRVSCWLNHAACCLKLKDYLQAINLCSKVLEVESCNVKALYRRAQAYVETSDFESAKTDILKALELDPHNKELRSLQVNLKKLQIESNKRDVKLYAKMFDRTRRDSDEISKKCKVEIALSHEEMKVGAMESGDVEKAQQVVKEDRGP